MRETVAYMYRSNLRINKGERGEGKVKAVIVTLILAFGVFAAVKMVPPYMANYQLSDKIQEISRFAVVSNQSEDQIRDQVYKTVQDLDIPIKKEDIKVSSVNRNVSISIDYNVPIDLKVYQFDMHFTPASQNRALF